MAKQDDELKAKILMIPPDELESKGVLQRAKKSGYVCPDDTCANGTGSDGTGLIFKDMGNHYGAKCQKCGNRFNNFHFLAKHYNLDRRNDYLEIIRRTAEDFNLNVSVNKKPADDNKIKIIHADIAEARKKLESFMQSRGGKYRAITFETANIYGCGVSPEWKPINARRYPNATATPRFICARQNGYLARLIGDIEKYKSAHDFKYIKEKPHEGSKSDIFGADLVWLNAELIIVVEGEFDCMSIYQATGGKIPVIATSGAAEYKKVVTWAMATFTAEHKPKFLILFDPDDTGRRMSHELRDALIENKFPACCKYFSDDNCKLDANEILQQQGDEVLAEYVEKFISDAQDEFKKISAEIQQRDDKEKSIQAEIEQEQSESIKDFNMTDKMRAIVYRKGFTDLDNANRLAVMFENELRYIADIKRWVFYKDGVWNIAPDGSPSSAFQYGIKAKDIIIGNARDKDEKNIAYPFTQHKKLSPACSILRGVERIRITEKDLNTHKNLLNCQNGVVDLQTGKLYHHDSKLLLTQCVNAEYIPDLHSDILEKFFADILPDEETRIALLRYLGYSLTGECREEKALFIHGAGGNGKGTLTKTVSVLFNTYACNFPIEAILMQRNYKDADSATPALNKLKWQRLAIADEIPDSRKLDFAKLKIITGGDPLPIRKLYQEADTIQDPTHTLILSGNHVPELGDAHDPGLIRRLLTMKFAQDFTNSKCDSNLKWKLQQPEVLNALLSVLVKEAGNYYRDGLIISSAMTADRQEYLNSNDFITDFISEHCILDENKSCSRKQILEELRNNYHSECSGKTDITLTNMIKRVLATQLNKSDTEIYCKGGRNKTYQFYGIGLLSDSEKTLSFEGITPSEENNSSPEKPPAENKPPTIDLQTHSTQPEISEVQAMQMTYDLRFTDDKSDNEILEILISKGFSKEKAQNIIDNSTDLPF